MLLPSYFYQNSHTFPVLIISDLGLKLEADNSNKILHPFEKYAC